MAAVADTVELGSALVRRWAHRFLDAWNALDPEGVAALCSEDVVWKDPSASTPFVGRKGVREFVQLTGAAFPDLHIAETAPPHLMAGSSKVLSPYRMTGTMLGRLDVFAPTARKLSIAGIDEWIFRGELLCGYCTYYDTIDAARQLGIMPASGSRAERLMARLQHSQARLQRRRSRVSPAS
jgi:steroid delta-isomerase-like uncharacterized protein